MADPILTDRDVMSAVIDRLGGRDAYDADIRLGFQAAAAAMRSLISADSPSELVQLFSGNYESSGVYDGYVATYNYVAQELCDLDPEFIWPLARYAYLAVVQFAYLYAMQGEGRSIAGMLTNLSFPRIIKRFKMEGIHAVLEYCAEHIKEPDASDFPDVVAAFFQVKPIVPVQRSVQRPSSVQEAPIPDAAIVPIADEPSREDEQSAPEAVVEETAALGQHPIDQIREAMSKGSYCIILRDGQVKTIPKEVASRYFKLAHKALFMYDGYLVIDEKLLGAPAVSLSGMFEALGIDVGRARVAGTSETLGIILAPQFVHRGEGKRVDGALADFWIRREVIPALAELYTRACVGTEYTPQYIAECLLKKIWGVI